MNLKYKIACFILLLSNIAHSQDIPIGQWRIHLPYYNTIAVTEAKNRIYCASNLGLFFYDKNDNQVQRLSKTSGLSDLQISTIKYNPTVDKLMICYSNTNIDFIVGGKQIVNMTDILRKSIPGLKTINRVSMSGEMAYLSCSFGIVVINMAKLEVEDTYYIGLGVQNQQIFDVTSDGAYLWAATDGGVFRGSLSDPFLHFNSEWSLMTIYPSCISNCPTLFNHIVYFKNKIFANCTFGYNNDTTYSFDGTAWNNSTIFQSQSQNRLDFEVTGNQMVVCDRFGVAVFDTTFNRYRYIYGYSNAVAAFQAILDKDGLIWIADNKVGLVRYTQDNKYEKVYPNGPGTNACWEMDVQNNNLWVVPGGYNNSFAASYNTDGVFTFQNSTWTTFNSNNTPLLTIGFHDFVHVAVNPSNPSQVFLGSYGAGLVEFDNNSFYKQYTPSNSLLQNTSISGDNGEYIGGLTFDSAGNLWVCNARANNMLAVKTPGGTWYSYNIPLWNNADASKEAESMCIDQSNQVWVIMRGGSLAVFNYGSTLGNTSGTQASILSTTINHGNLPGTVNCMALDQNGALWVGTSAGVAVIYSPGNVFSGSNYDAQQILIEQDGHAQYLLSAEQISAVAVDGANRKWFGTLGGGVFLMSADGTQQIYHFDHTNSPLLSDNIQAIKINQLTGEVFFGTDQGIVSFKSTATQGNETCSPLIFPNPVKSSYTGTIGIKGLVENMTVKITDITGTLVYETTAEGGEATWNGTNFKGQRPATGVYLVFCTNSDGSQTCTGKLLFVN